VQASLAALGGRGLRPGRYGRPRHNISGWIGPAHFTIQSADLFRLASGELVFLAGLAACALYALRWTRSDRAELRKGLLYTDGVVEAINGEGEEFGGGPLRAFLADDASLDPAALCDSLLAEVAAWTGSELGNPGDHVTLPMIEFPSA